MMICEYGDCRSSNGKDYKRNKNEQEKGWEDEPIFLCLEHSIGHEALCKQNMQVGLDENNNCCLQEFKRMK